MIICSSLQHYVIYIPKAAEVINEYLNQVGEKLQVIPAGLPASTASLLFTISLVAERFLASAWTCTPLASH